MAEENKTSGESTTQAPPGRRRGRVHRLKRFVRHQWKTLLVVLAIIGVLFLTYSYLHTRNELKRLSNPTTATKDETKKLVEQVGKLIILPDGETPTLATVKDATKLKTQEFFARAENGDKVLIYTKSGRAVLYRPSDNKVVEYSKINLNNTQ